MVDLPTLRKHEAALNGMRIVGVNSLSDFRGPGREAHQTRVDALDYALAHLREEIAKAEVCPHCINGRLGKYACQYCHGTGKRPTEVT